MPFLPFLGKASKKKCVDEVHKIPLDGMEAMEPELILLKENQFRPTMDLFENVVNSLLFFEKEFKKSNHFVQNSSKSDAWFLSNWRINFFFNA